MNSAQIIIQPFSQQQLGSLLKAALTGQIRPFHTFRAAVAFVKRSGVQHIAIELEQFVGRGGQAQFVVGIDQLGSSQEGLLGLLAAVGQAGTVFINKTTETYVTFHPKVYLFSADEQALLIVGSGNLTEGGLYTNDEASMVYRLDLHDSVDVALWQEINAYLDKWCDIQDGNAVLLTRRLINELVEAGLVSTEVIGAGEQGLGTATPPSPKPTLVPSFPAFRKSMVRRVAPRNGTATRKPKRTTSEVESVPKPIEPLVESPIGFVMLLQRTDVGSGQTTSGTGRRSPEVFIPLAARDAFPDFWSWPTLFVEDAVRPGKHDRSDVRMRIGGELVLVNMMTWPVKHDFRLRSEALRSAGQVGDILRIEKPSAEAAFDYYVQIIPPGTSDYKDYLNLCSHPVRNSQKRWGYYR